MKEFLPPPVRPARSPAAIVPASILPSIYVAIPVIGLNLQPGAEGEEQLLE
jgi:hypothetical protein